MQLSEILKWNVLSVGEIPLSSFFRSYTSDETKMLLIVLLLDISKASTTLSMISVLLAQFCTFCVSISARNWFKTCSSLR